MSDIESIKNDARSIRLIKGQVEKDAALISRITKRTHADWFDKFQNFVFKFGKFGSWNGDVAATFVKQVKKNIPVDHQRRVWKWFVDGSPMNDEDSDLVFNECVQETTGCPHDIPIFLFYKFGLKSMYSSNAIHKEWIGCLDWNQTGLMENYVANYFTQWGVYWLDNVGWYEVFWDHEESWQICHKVSHNCIKKKVWDLYTIACSEDAYKFIEFLNNLLMVEVEDRAWNFVRITRVFTGFITNIKDVSDFCLLEENQLSFITLSKALEKKRKSEDGES
jgi:hypothetical protein